MKDVYLLHHEYEIKGEWGIVDETKLIGVFSTQEKAEKIAKLRFAQPGFRDHPFECFEISKYSIDTHSWAEGFSKWSDNGL